MSTFEPGLADQRLAAISASVAGLVRDHYGRDSIEVKSYALGDILVVVISGQGFTSIEKAAPPPGRREGWLCSTVNSMSWG